jgi:tetratricopeptide (TPR) repeat protein
MTDSERRAAEADATVTTADPAPAEPAAPEPWTPERVLDWNRYYDVYVVATVLVLVFLGAAFPLSNPSIWPNLQAGRLIAQQGPFKLTHDPFSYTMYGQKWVNIPWLYQVVSGKLWDVAQNVSPRGGASLGATLLVLATCLARVLTAVFLLRLCSRGPGLWWAAVCVALAVGAVIRPLPLAPGDVAAVLGGVAGWGEVESATWSLPFLALELLLLHRASTRGSRAALFGLVPLMAVWANTDEGFLFGLLVLTLWTVGILVQGRLPGPGRRRPSVGAPEALAPGLWLGVLAGSWLVPVLNPSFFSIYSAAARPYLELLGRAAGPLTTDRLSYFGTESRAYFDRIHGGEGTGASRLYIAYYILLVAAGVLSFVLNRARFSLPRFLVFVLASAMFAALVPFGSLFAVVLAAFLLLNGQEWYQGVFGTEGHVGAGWQFWSVGGRAVTLLALTAMIVKGLTGFGTTPRELNFGFGVVMDDFAFEAADYLALAPVQGNILNLTLATGDALIWRAWPKNTDRKTFVDGRDRLFPASLRTDLETIKRGLARSEPDVWRPLLDRYNPPITTVMVPMSEPRIHDAMAASKDWIPYYDDGLVALFGRADAGEKDLAYFRDNRLDAARLAFQAGHVVQSSTEVPTLSAGLYDRIFRNRFSKSVQPHALAAERWLMGSGLETGPDVARCLMAIGEARTALAREPNDTYAWRRLADAYQLLHHQELEILRSAGAAVMPDFYRNLRLSQQAMALSFAIETTPPPQTADERRGLGQLHGTLAGLYESANMFDLASEHFQEASRLLGADFSPEFRPHLEQLQAQVEAVRERLVQSEASPQSNPLVRADYARQQGMPGLAIEQLEQAESYGIDPRAAKARLLDLYLQTGRPDLAIRPGGAMGSLGEGDVEDPDLATGAGTASYRQGILYGLIGAYDVALTLLGNRAIPQVRSAQADSALEATRGFLRGMVTEAREGLLSMAPEVETQAAWEVQLGLLLLEDGKPKEAAARFTTALTLAPDLALRPLLEHYLTQIGEPVPSRSATAEGANKAPAPAPANTAEPTTSPTSSGAAPEALPGNVFAPATPAPTAEAPKP